MAALLNSVGGFEKLGDSEFGLWSEDDAVAGTIPLRLADCLGGSLASVFAAL